jgi:PST family polysaccharide transporter
MAALQAQTTDSDIGAGGRLDRALFSGIAWTAVLRWLSQAISWVGTLYAARILKPSDYGLVAMAMLPIGLLRMVEDLGLDSVLVQDRTLRSDQIARLAGLALLLATVLAAGLIAASRIIAEFFREPAVALLIAVLSMVFIFDALQIVPRALLQRDLRFLTLAALAAAQFAVGSTTLIVSAKLGFGHWSLIFNTLVSGLVVTVLLIWLRPFPIAWPNNVGSIAASIKSGWRLLVSRAAWYGYSNADQTIIGRMLDKDALGAYSFASSLAGLPIQEISSVVSRVVPGVFSAAQEQCAELRRYFLLLTEALAYLAFPAAVGLALTADRVVHIALGAQWQSVIMPFRILCFYYAAYAAQVLVSHILLWTGRFRVTMWLSILGVVCLVAAFLVAVRWGIVGVAWSWVIMFPLLSLPALIIAARIMQMRVRQFFVVLAPAALGCLIMSAVVIGVRRQMPDGLTDLIALAVEAGAGAATYALVLLIAFRARVAAILSVVFARPGR